MLCVRLFTKELSIRFDALHFFSHVSRDFLTLYGVVAAFRFATCLRPVGETAL